MRIADFAAAVQQRNWTSAYAAAEHMTEADLDHLNKWLRPPAREARRIARAWVA